MSQTAVADLCPDWVFSTGSSAHACRDSEWFSDYTPFETEATDMAGSRSRVAGVGAVELQVLKNPHLTGQDNIGTLRLSNVLHIPSCRFNIIGHPLMLENEYNIEWSDGNDQRGAITDANHCQIAHFMKDRPLYVVKLSDPPKGTKLGLSAFEPGKNYAISCFWSASERRRYEAYEAVQTSAACRKYTENEKKWLKDNYGSEFRFLVEHGLSIYKEEDREDGRTILRRLMGDG